MESESLHSFPDIDQFLNEYYELAGARGYPADGSWRGRPPPAPQTPKAARDHFNQWIKDMNRSHLDYAAWFTDALHSRLLKDRLGEALERLERAEARLIAWDPSGYIEEILSTGNSLSPHDYGHLIESLVWRYGDTLLRAPEVLERYILGPIRQAHPGLFVPRLPWLLWRTHPAIPDSFRLSLRLWFAHHFGLPDHQVQSVVMQGFIFAHDGDLALQVCGPAASAWWPDFGPDDFQDEESWRKLYPRLLAAVDKEMRRSETPSGPGPRTSQWAFTIQDHVGKDQVRLFSNGFVPNSDRPNVLVLQPLRRQDSYLAEILQHDYGLPMLAPLPLRAGPELQFPTEGDLEDDRGLEETRPFSVPSLHPDPSTDEAAKAGEKITDTGSKEPSASEPGDSALGRGW